MVSPLDQMPDMPSQMGVGSGIDTNRMVDNLVQAERAPREERLARREEEIQTKLEALGQLRGGLGELQEALQGLASADAYSGIETDSSNPEVVGVSAGEGARPGEYEVEVEQRARAQRVATASGAFEDASDPLATGRLILVDAQGREQAVTIDDDQNTLLGVRDAINDQAEGVRASVVDDGEGPRLALATERTGAENALVQVRAELDEAERADPEPRQRLATPAGMLDSPDESLGTGTLTFTDAQGREETVTVGEGQQTLGGVRDAINDQAGLVRASISEDGRLVLQPREAGAESAITRVRAGEIDDGRDISSLMLFGDDEEPDLAPLQYNVEDGEGRPAGALEEVQSARELLDPEEREQRRERLQRLQLGVEDDEGRRVGAFEQIQEAADAVATIDGMRVTRSENTIEGAIEGATLELQGEGRSRVSIREQTGLAEENIQRLVETYNQLRGQLSDLSGYDPETEEAGPLQGDHTVRNIDSQLRRAMTEPVAGMEDEPIQSLSELGVRTNRDGTLELDSGQLQEVASRHSEAVTRLMTDPEDGVAARLERTLENAVGSDGFIETRTDGLESRLDGIADDRERLDSRMERREEQLRDRFARMDSRVAELNQTSDFLEQRLAGMDGDD